MVFYLQKNGRATFSFDQEDLDDILDVRLTTRGLERRLARLDDNVLASTVEINAIVPIYTSPSRIGRRAATLIGQLNEEVLILRIFNEDPSEGDPTTGIILYIELVNGYWIIGDRWYRFDDGSYEEVDTPELCQIYLGTLPVAGEEAAAAEM